MSGLKDNVKRELVMWNDITQRIWFNSIRGLPSEIKAALMFDITTQRLAEIATLRDEKLIRNSFEATIEVVKKRKKRSRSKKK